jgi:hypothetical protein
VAAQVHPQPAARAANQAPEQGRVCAWRLACDRRLLRGLPNRLVGQGAMGVLAN